MAIANFTGVEKHPQTFLQMRCSADLSTGIHQQWIYLSAFNIFLSITAVLGNTLILVALRKETSLHPPSKLFCRCLATTDLCVGVVVQPIGVVYLMSVVHEDLNLCSYALRSAYITSSALCSVSLLTVTAISVDRLLALLLGLRYKQIVTLKRTYVTVVIFWVVSTVASTLFLLNQFITIWYGNIVISLCLVTSVVSYCKIFLTLRHHQTQVQDHVQQEQPSQINPLNIARYKKAVYSALWVQCTLLACYLPFGIVLGMHGNNRLTPSESLIWHLAATLVYFNSSLDPFLYCWKINEVKQAVKQTIREALYCLST